MSLQNPRPRVARFLADSLAPQTQQFSGAKRAIFLVSAADAAVVRITINDGDYFRVSLTQLSGTEVVAPEGSTGIERITVDMETAAAAGVTIEAITGDFSILST